MKIINPATEELVQEIVSSTEQSLDQSFEELSIGQHNWKLTSLASRVQILAKFSDLLAEEAAQLAYDLSSEMGKPLAQAKNEINGARGRITWMLNNAEKYLNNEVMTDIAGLQEIIVHEPLGVVCNISAWNYPFLVGVNVFIPALLAGNTVMYKPSEYATLTGLNIQRLLYAAGIPENCFKVAIGAKDVGEYLLNLPFNGYFFTGSYATGKYIYEKVAKKMVVCQCELGGKDPLYIADDIHDIEKVAAATADGAFYNNGQSCCAVERIYVHEKIASAYIEAFVKEVKSWKIGNPFEDGVYIGPLSRAAQISLLENQISDAVEKGATILSGGKRIVGKGYYFEPTVLTNVTHDMLVMREESFGPVIGISVVKDDEEAIDKMNDTAFGLTAGVYANDEERARKILDKMNSGTGYWNCCDRVSAPLPWSGRKHSGIGSTLSYVGLRAFTQPKALHLKRP
ncbi:MAG: aldehyde dehydrogenase family protein [Sediminibacterium sp.]|jgi:acyl-CoA reductase-like NAD-dependent aldehyde dehydrogenase|nr:aldehyde dehydrogenase family protein [Chitinophagaceae bacterium]